VNVPRLRWAGWQSEPAKASPPLSDRRAGLRASALLAGVMALGTLAAGCAYDPCRDGDNSRYKCDASTVQLTPEATEPTTTAG